MTSIKLAVELICGDSGSSIGVLDVPVTAGCPIPTYTPFLPIVRRHRARQQSALILFLVLAAPVLLKLSSINDFVLAAFLLLCSGCARYWPSPLTHLRVEDDLRPSADAQLCVAAQQINHPILRPIQFNADDGISPDEAAIIAVIKSPELRAQRDRHNIACAQLVQAKLLPNPVLDASLEFPSGGLTADTVTAYNLGLNWEITSLIGRSSRVKAAALQPPAIALDIAWLEWSAAESAKSATYSWVALNQQAALAQQLDQRLNENLALIRQAVARGIKTNLDLAGAEAATSTAHTRVLDLHSQIAQQQIKLNRELGLPAEFLLRIQSGFDLPLRIDPPPMDKMLAGLADRRLDLVGLRIGYDSQEATLRAAVLRQFPKLNVGVLNARDTSNVVTTGFGVSLDVPIFDRNQGAIAQEKATRQRLYDEYVNRYYQARSDIVMFLTQMTWLNAQIEARRAADLNQQHLLETYRAALDRGQADAVVYYTAWITLTEGQIETAKLQQQLMEARISLELASGIYELCAVCPPAPLPEELPILIQPPSR